MKKQTSKDQTHKNNKLWMILFVFSGVEGLIAAGILVSLPSDSNILFGLSPARMAILLVIVTLVVLNALLAFFPFKFRFISHNIERRPGLVILTGLVCAGLLLTSLAVLYDLYTGIHTYYFLAYAQRLAPLLVYVALILVQMSILLIWQNRDRWLPIVNREKPFLFIWGITYGSLLILIILIILTRLGLTRDAKGWGDPTVPLMEWQIWLGILICLLVRIFSESRLLLVLSRWQRDNPISSGILVSCLIWSLAVVLWASQPVPPGFFATPPRAPNYEIYPFSDAAFYDHYAQSMIIGLGFRGESIPPRPLYIIFLAIDHLIAGQDYTTVIFVQTLLLALFPVTVYWIGRKLASNTVGWICALFVILREWTSIVSTPFTSDISNTKLLFADIPAALAISIVVLCTIIWLKNPRRPIHGLLTGGVLGISLLVRTQTIILFPVILVFFWIELIRFRDPVKSFILPTVLFLLGIFLAVAPWLSRNFGITGQLVFDHPESQNRIMVQRYYPEIEPDEFDRWPGESTSDYSQRLSNALRDRIIQDPLYVTGFVSAHWVNSEIANLQIFPVRFSIVDFVELVKPIHPFWEEWDGSANIREVLVMLINLAILAAGAVFLFRRNSWAGLFPLLINLAYNFSNAAARNSGWRYLLPVDWVFLLYFSAGIFALIHLGNQQPVPQPELPVKKHPGRMGVPIFSLAAVSIGILCLGFAPLVAERAFPRKYEQASSTQLRETILKNAGSLEPDEIVSLEKMLESSETMVLHGRMLYPRFYDANDGVEKTAKTGYAPMPYARYVFLVAGDPEGTIIFPQTRDDIPLRNAQDVILVGCMDGLAVKANLVILPEQNFASYSADPKISWVCPGQQ